MGNVLLRDAGLLVTKFTRDPPTLKLRRTCRKAAAFLLDSEGKRAVLFLEAIALLTWISRRALQRNIGK